jgi:transglutaminase-like putative cysteine protease
MARWARNKGGMTYAPMERAGGIRLGAFAGLSALAAYRYAAIETRPPTARVVTVAASAVVAAAALMLLRARDADDRRARAGAASARLLVLAALFVVALLAAGVPLGLLRPARWGALSHHLNGGLGSLGTTLWPYSGRDGWTRVDILLGLVAIPLGAAALGFWPIASGHKAAALRHRIRQVLALVLLLGLYVVGVLDSGGGSITAEGLLLLVLVVAWLWLPGLGRPRVTAALAWLAAAGALAALLAGLIGTRQAWLDYRAWGFLGAGQASVSFSWDQSYGPITWSRSQQTMFEVGAPRPQLWKVTTLDRFDGLRFLRSGVDDGGSLNYPDLPLPLNQRWYAFATFTIEGLHAAGLPSQQGTTVGVRSARPVQYELDGTTRIRGPAPGAGVSYTTLAYVPAPTPAELRAAPRAFPPVYLRFTDFDLPGPGQSGLRVAATDRQRPGVFFTARTVGAPRPGVPPAAVPAVERRIVASPYAGMYRLARQLATGRRSSYDVAVAMVNYLQANYHYGEQPPRRRFPLEAFLFTDGVGYCQLFSGAMALMLRMDGIPARVAAGFLPGSYDDTTHRFVVRAVDAHSWVEVFFTGIGWVPFNPTPSRTTAPIVRFPSARTANPPAAIAATLGSAPIRVTDHPMAGRGKRGSRSGSFPLSALIALALACVLAPMALSVRWLRGLVRLRRSLAGDGELATRELVRALARLGYTLPATVTLARVESIVRLHGGSDAARYVRLLSDRRYGPGSVASATLRDRRRLRLALTAHLGLDARLRGLWALPPATVGWRVTRFAPTRARP